MSLHRERQWHDLPSFLLQEFFPKSSRQLFCTSALLPVRRQHFGIFREIRQDCVQILLLIRLGKRAKNFHRVASKMDLLVVVWLGFHKCSFNRTLRIKYCAPRNTTSIRKIPEIWTPQCVRLLILFHVSRIHLATEGIRPAVRMKSRQCSEGATFPFDGACTLNSSGGRPRNDTLD
jgi:hypothetical protein